MDDKNKISIPLLTAENFLEWQFKMKNVLCGKDNFPDPKHKALSIISPQIHKSLISTVTVNGGEDDPIVLWKNIICKSLMFNISASMLKFRDAISKLKSLELEIDKHMIGHLILSKIPPSPSIVQDSIISTGQMSMEVTYELVLDMLDKKVKTKS
ncbi:uncharacterized protein VP01_859g2 [Puccinia sorghi]|uniref:Uncharacterized protein n=1 Tax=Puccinia sorghi TaxID=27349 RepID=A0A0L6U8X5_9BASI|nr:uncharacterized protein VP01_859g2 [Puccinia sorghi]